MRRISSLWAILLALLLFSLSPSAWAQVAENFNTASPPAIPSTVTADSAYATVATPHYGASGNALANTTTDGAGHYAILTAASDYSAAAQTFTFRFYIGASGTDLPSTIVAFARNATATSTLDGSIGLVISPISGTVSIYYWNGSSGTDVGGFGGVFAPAHLTGTASFASSTWYTVTLKLPKGGTASADRAVLGNIKRESDSQWLQTNGTWASGQPSSGAVSWTNSVFDVTGSGYAGVATQVDTGQRSLTLDDFGVGAAAVVVETGYHFATAGNDSTGDGSAGTPYATIAKANTLTLNPGDKLLFNGGDTFTGTLTVGTSGTASAPIVVQSYGTGRAIINGGDASAIYEHSAEFVTINNLNLKGSGVVNTSGTTTFSSGMGTAKKAVLDIYDDRTASTKLRGITVTNCLIHDGFNGLKARTDTSKGGDAKSTSIGFDGLTISGNTVYNCVEEGITVQGGYLAPAPRTWDFPVGIANKNVVVTSNEIYNVFGYSGSTQVVGSGLYIGNSLNALAAYNKIHDIAINSSTTSAGGPSGFAMLETQNGMVQFNEIYLVKTNQLIDGCGIDFDGGCVNCIAQFNYTHDNDGPALMTGNFAGSSPSSGNVFRFNLSERDLQRNGLQGNLGVIFCFGGSNAIWHHNTIYLAPKAGGGDNPQGVFISTGTSGCVVANNLFIASADTIRIADVRTTFSYTLLGNVYATPTGAGTAKFLTGSGSGTTVSGLVALRTAGGGEVYQGANVGLELANSALALGTYPRSSALSGIPTSGMISTLAAAYGPAGGSPVLGVDVLLPGADLQKPGWSGAFGNQTSGVGIADILNIASLANNYIVGAGGGSGTVPAAGDVRSGVAVGSGVGSLVVPAANKVLAGTTFDANTAGTATVPTAAQVLVGVTYGTGGSALTGTVTLPAASNVRSSITFGPSLATTGTLTLPSISNVLSGTAFGAGGNEFTGTAASSGGSGLTLSALQGELDTRGLTSAKVSGLPTAAQIVTALLAATIDGSLTMKQAMAIDAAISAGKANAPVINTVSHTQTTTYYRVDGTTPIVVFTTTYLSDNKTIVSRTITFLNLP